MSDPEPTFAEVLEGIRSRVDERLEAHLTDLSDACPDRLRNAIHHSLMAGGKRLRPILVLLACEACGGDERTAMPAACALEMVHTYSLIHDDLPAMDDDDLRRGRPTCHIAFDEATAILAGDALLTWAFEIIARDVEPGAIAAECCAVLAHAAGAEGMVGGQMADLADPRDSIHGVERLQSIHERKTAALLSSSLRVGALVAGADRATIDCLNEYGKSVGLAFQIADDLLDVLGNPETMGKRLRKDEDRGKLTYPSLLGIEESRRHAETLIAHACEQLRPFGVRGRRLEQLARFVLERDH